MAKSWPPDDWKPIYKKYNEWAAWYSGDPMQLLDNYTSQVNYFWQQEIEKDRKTMLHVPVAGDIAETSANLLLSEQPDIKIPEAHEENAKSEAKDAQDRLNEISDEIDLYSRLLEGAETASPLGGIFLKVNWNTDFKPFPVLSVAQPDNAIPIFKWGFLQEVIFHKIIDKDGRDKYLRHIERHKPGVIINELWDGTKADLGSKVDLSYHPKTKNMEEEIKTGLDGLACRYIPNKKPNRLWRGSELGQSDLSGIEGLMDAVDEVYTSWLRDIRLGKGRIIVPDYMLEVDEDNKFRFNVDREVYEKINAGPASADDEGNLTVSQFDIRAEKHQKTANSLLEMAFKSAGYSPQTFGMNTDGGGYTTATEVKAKEDKSFKTRNKKAKYFQNGIEDALYMLLQIDNIHFNGPKPFRPQVNLRDSVQTDPLDRADSIEKLNRAAALSIMTKVEMLHPKWTDKQKKKEVERIMKENGMMVEGPEMRA